MKFPDKYDHKATEEKWQKFWADNGVYEWKDDLPREQTFVIDTPPPTVSGVLHMGHVFSYCQADFIARFQRMSGKDVFYPIGFDDNGLPTERLVEKERKIRATDLSREEFIKVCQEVVIDAEKEFEKLFNSIALSVDWRQKYETISERSRKISQLSFLDLFEKGEVYRKYQPMFWDPVDQTAIAQAEIVDKEMESAENYLWFGIDGSDERIEIMTTRPEMLPACVAVMVHPDNFAKYNGKQAVTPLFHVKVPILADDKVDKEKGTGFVMCCTFGDETDIKWWREYDLPMRIVLNKFGKLDLSKPRHPQGAESEPGDLVMASSSRDPRASHGEPEYDMINLLNGLKVKAARDKVVELLEAGQFVSREKKKIAHTVKTAERSGAPLEIVPTYQWFVKLMDKKERLKEKINECQWFPEFMKVRAEQWNESLNWDWCISRQRYFGVPFPVWYSKRAGEEGRILTAHPDDLPVDPMQHVPRGYTADEVTPDFDVMDTWATSSVSPQLSSHYGIDPERHAKLFPADMRPQAHEIIRTWAYYTIAKSLLHEDKIPWKNVFISGWCLAEDKSKMSKSKGNVITPVPLVESKSSDVVRYWAATSSLGADTAYSEDVLKIGGKLVNKLWNACKFASINLSKLEENAVVTEVLDKWILGRLNITIRAATESFGVFEYSKARMYIEEFFWKDFCDNYLEMVKARSYNEIGDDEAGQQSALQTIRICVERLLRLWAPFVPHISEELYNIIFDSDESIHRRGNWPLADLPEDEAAEKIGFAAVELLENVRRDKSEKNISIKFPIKKMIIGSQFEVILSDIKNVTNSGEIVFSDDQEQVAIEY